MRSTKLRNIILRSFAVAFVATLSTSFVGLDPMPATHADDIVLAANTEQAQAKADAKVERIGLQVDNFALQDYRGKEHQLADYQDKPVIVLLFLGTECPLVKLYAPRLVEMQKKYTDHGVQFLAINANQQDSMTEIAAYARRHEIPFPILRDSGNQLADKLHAIRTPEVYVLDQQRSVRYWGRIDNQYGVGYIRNGGYDDYLGKAIDDLLAGREVVQSSVMSVGCYIGRIREPKVNSPVTYSNQIARVFQNHCVECHREGEIAPFTLSNYDDVVGWGETIAEVIEDQRMPPWHADPAHGKFANSRGMTSEEKQQVYDWVDSGCPEGNPQELPKSKEYLVGWQLPREPDVVIPMRDRPFDVKAEGDVAYQYFVTDPGFKEDKWVAGAEVIPGNRAVVHHVIVFIRPPDGKSIRGLGWLTGYVPGQRVDMLPDGMALHIPAGAKLVFQMHYTPNGSVEQDLTKLGLVFVDEKTVEKEVVTLVSMDNKFEIPPHDDSYRVDSTMRNFPADGELLAITPHMHLRGKDFRVNLLAENGDPITTLLNVPNYDFNWQSIYQLAQPWKPGGKKYRFECVAHFNNSESNLANPDPSASVRWGDQTWEEMMIGFFEVAIPRRDLEKNQTKEPEIPALTADQQKRIKQMVGKLTKDLDTNEDGIIERSEVATQFARFGFGRFDHNNNDILEPEELALEVEARVRRKSRR